MKDNSALYVVNTAQLIGQFVEELWKICERIRLSDWLELDFWKICGSFVVEPRIVIGFGLNYIIKLLDDFWKIFGIGIRMFNDCMVMHDVITSIGGLMSPSIFFCMVHVRWNLDGTWYMWFNYTE